MKAFATFWVALPWGLVLPGCMVILIGLCVAICTIDEWKRGRTWRRIKRPRQLHCSPKISRAFMRAFRGE